MKNVPPVLHGNEWDWPSDGSAEAWPEYLKEIPVRQLLRQVEYSDASLDRGTDFTRSRKVAD
jgi:hypothetical protein